MAVPPAPAPVCKPVRSQVQQNYVAEARAGWHLEKLRMRRGSDQTGHETLINNSFIDLGIRTCIQYLTFRFTCLKRRQSLLEKAFLYCLLSPHPSVSLSTKSIPLLLSPPSTQRKCLKITKLSPTVPSLPKSIPYCPLPPPQRQLHSN